MPINLLRVVGGGDTIVDKNETSCMRLANNGFRTDKFMKTYCKDCGYQCEGKTCQTCYRKMDDSPVTCNSCRKNNYNKWGWDGVKR